MKEAIQLGSLLQELPQNRELRTTQQGLQVFSQRANQLLQDFNPSNQIAIFEQGDRAFIGSAPSLAQIRREEGDKVVTAWVYAQLVNLNEVTGVKDKMSTGQLRETAGLIVSIAYYLKISELMVFFVKFKGGEYGRFYGVVDSGVVMDALQQFIKWRNDKLAAIERKIQREKMFTDPKEVQTTEWVKGFHERSLKRAAEIRAERERKEKAQ